MVDWKSGTVEHLPPEPKPFPTCPKCNGPLKLRKKHYVFTDYGQEYTEVWECDPCTSKERL